MKRIDQQYTYQLFNQKTPASAEWMFKEMKAFEPENNGEVTFVPADRFDAAINLWNVGAPHFQKKQQELLSNSCQVVIPIVSILSFPDKNFGHSARIILL